MAASGVEEWGEVAPAWLFSLRQPAKMITAIAAMSIKEMFLEVLMIVVFVMGKYDDAYGAYRFRISLQGGMTVSEQK